MEASWALAIVCTIARPSPTPSAVRPAWELSRWNGSKRRVSSPVGISGPVFAIHVSRQAGAPADLTALSRSELDAALSGEHEHRAASAVELVADLSGDDHMTFRRTGL